MFFEDRNDFLKCDDIGYATEPVGGIYISDQAIRLKCFAELAHILCQFDRDIALYH